MSARHRLGISLAAVLLMGALLALAALHMPAGHAAAPTAAATALTVPVAPVEQRSVPIYLEYVGTTDAIRSVTLEAQVTGYLQRYAVHDGAEVRRGELLYQIDPRTYQAALDQARAQQQRDSAAHEYAVDNRQRDEGLVRTGDVSVDAVQQATSTEHQAAAAQAADRAAIESAQLNLGYASIRAPFDGRLSYTQVHEGALITVAGTQLNTLVQLDPIYATFNPPDTDLPRIEQAQSRGPVGAEVLIGDAQRAAYHGNLTFLDNNVDRNSGTITARATIANPDHRLLPGQFVRVRLHLGELPDALLIPQVAVQSSQLGQYVYVIGADEHAEQRPVTLGADYGPLVVVTRGVRRGEWVATGNLLRLNPNASVHPLREPTASPAAAPQRPGS